MSDTSPGAYARSVSTSVTQETARATGSEPETFGWVPQIVRIALDEDLGAHPGRDVTTQATIDSGAVRSAHLMAREEGVVAGLIVIQEVLDQVAERFSLAPVTAKFLVSDGTRVAPGMVLTELRGPVQALLTAERTLLNLVSRASGVASATRAWADTLVATPRADGSHALVLDTRKTTPGLRALEKYAVRCGGGANKRMGLFDVAMVKDNHVVAAGSIPAAIERIRQRFPDVLVQVEADTTAQALEAVEAGAKFLLLDNMASSDLADTVRAVRELEEEPGRIELEATGNLTLGSAAEVAATGVDYLSVGALTHSAPILDLALDLQ